MTAVKVFMVMEEGQVRRTGLEMTLMSQGLLLLAMGRIKDRGAVLKDSIALKENQALKVEVTLHVLASVLSFSPVFILINSQLQSIVVPHCLSGL